MLVVSPDRMDDVSSLMVVVLRPAMLTSDPEERMPCPRLTDPPRGVSSEAARLTSCEDLSTKDMRGALRWGKPCISVPSDSSCPSQPYKIRVISALL
jgi:hypothetical protein